MAVRVQVATANAAILNERKPWQPESSLATKQRRYSSYCLRVPLILIFGLGGHASKNALAPAEPSLLALGFSPLAYSILAAAPIVGAIVTPTLWGAWFAKREQLVLIVVPLGVLVGQMMLTAGLVLYSRDANAYVVAMFIGIGMVVFVIARAGVGVVQHSAMARAMPVGLTGGFVGVVACTHLAKAACQWCVPRIIDVAGMTGVMLALLLPSTMSVGAGYLLGTVDETQNTGPCDDGAEVGAGAESLVLTTKRGACPADAEALACPPRRYSCPTSAESPPSVTERCSCENQAHADSLAGVAERCDHLDDKERCSRADYTKRGKCTGIAERRIFANATERCNSGKTLACCETLPPARSALMLLGLWRALGLGLLHAYESVTNAFLVEGGMGPDETGSVLAATHSFTLVTLLFVGVMGDVVGRKCLLVITSLLSFVATSCLSAGFMPPSRVGYAALSALAIAGVMGAVLPLSLVPSNARTSELGYSYGMMDSLFSLAQCLFLWTIGILRTAGGFEDVNVFVSFGFGLSLVLVVAVVWVAEDDVGQRRPVVARKTLVEPLCSTRVGA